MRSQVALEHGPRPRLMAPLPSALTPVTLVWKQVVYLGSISFSPDSTTVNREVGIIIKKQSVARQVQATFDLDFATKSIPYTAIG